MIHTKNAKVYFRDAEIVVGSSSDASISFAPATMISGTFTMSSSHSYGGIYSGITGEIYGGNTVSGGWEPFYAQRYCEACGGDISQNDHVAVQIGEDASVYFHKGCYIHPNNQDMIRGLVVAEDLM